MAADNAVDDHDDIIYPATIPFLLVHLACFAAFWTGVTWQAVVLGLALYWLRMFAVTAGFHRYFSHRAYATSRVFQFVLAVLAQSSVQKNVLWWAAQHRHHHQHSDTPDDVHSPRHKGFLYSHVGWIFDRRRRSLDLTKVADLARYPELIWLMRLSLVPPIVLAVACFLIAGWPGLIVGFFWSTVAVHHATFAINSLAHVSGSTRYVTGDDSRNNWLLALITMGEGWHNNHHAYQSSARQGFKWWEIDLTYYILRALARIGIVWELKMPPESVLRNERRLGARVIHRAAEQLAARFNSERIAAATVGALHGTQLASLKERLIDAGHRGTEALAALQLPHMPKRDDLAAQAQAMFKRTPSMDDIVDRAHAMLLTTVGARLVVAVDRRRRD
jgi:stearoyl-CoA desaturase (delta-9 desaturase)